MAEWKGRAEELLMLPQIAEWMSRMVGLLIRTKDVAMRRAHRLHVLHFPSDYCKAGEATMAAFFYYLDIGTDTLAAIAFFLDHEYGYVVQCDFCCAHAR